MALSLQIEPLPPEDDEGKSLKAYWDKFNSIQLTEAKNGVTPDELMFFTSQLALMMETGTPINRSLPVIAEVIENKYLKSILLDLRECIVSGRSLSQGLQLYPDVFDNLYVSLVKAGESSGMLREMFDRLVELQKKNEKFASEVKSAMMYPIFLVSFSFIVVLIIMIFVFPKFSELFVAIKDELPITTIMLMYVSDMLVNQWYYLVAGITVVVYGIYKWFQSDKAKEQVDYFFINMPVLKHLIIDIYISQFTRSFGFLLDCSVQLLEALEICRDASKSRIFKKFVNSIIDSVIDGRGISPAFAASRFLPVTVKQMVNTAEETGTLGPVLNRLADYYDEKVVKQLKNITSLAEPVLLILMGMIVGVIVFSLVLPIFKLSRAVH